MSSTWFNTSSETTLGLNISASLKLEKNASAGLDATHLSHSQWSDRSSLEVLQPALELAEMRLQEFASSPGLSDKMSLAFGSSWDVNQAIDFAKNWINQDFSQLPQITIVLGTEIPGANGAYAAETNTIYLARDFLTENVNNPQTVAAVLLEEIGHAIDVRINKTDAAGDEGDIFSRLVRGEKIGVSDLLSLKTENDHAWLKIDGHSTEIEMSQVAMATLNGRFYQSVQGTDNKIYTRWSTNGTNWSTWDNKGGGETLNAPSLAVLNNRLYQSHRGLDNKIYTRSSTDGQNWSNWATNGAGDTPNAPALTSHNGKLYQSIRGLDSNIYTRSSTDGQTWSIWNSNGVGQTSSAPALASFKGKLFQARQGTDNKIYTRSSADGVAWSSWSASNLQSTPSAITMTSLNGRLFQSIRGTDNKMYIRSSSDGFSWSQWTSDKVGGTPDAPSLAAFNGRLYQSHQGFDSNIYTRSSVDGVRWTTWSQSGGLTPTETPGLNVWRATYFNTNNLTGPAVINRLESAINYDWGTGSPDPRINRDNFSARWEGSFYFKQGVYAFKPNMDDGVRIWLDGQMVHDAWNSPSTTSFNRAMTAGAHQIKIEYRELGVNARAIFSTEEQLGVWNATYYNNSNLSGTPVVNRVDSAINFDWGTGSPDARINRDNFSARWEGKFAFDAGSYTFKPNTDDGVRIWIDNQLISDSWNSPTSTNFNREISAGIHQVTVEYRELAGNARANFSWEKSIVNPVMITAPVIITALDKLNGIRQITDPGGNYPGQCVSFVKRYTQELGITMNPTGGNGGAKFMFINYDKPGLSLTAAQADKITFTGTEKAQVGDIIVFDATQANPYGHIAVIQTVLSDGKVVIQESNANNRAWEIVDSNNDGIIGTTVTRSRSFNLNATPSGYGKVMGFLRLKL